MLRNLGTLVWRQSRELIVSNYSMAIVYELQTNYGMVYCIQDKGSKDIKVLSQEELNSSYTKDELTKQYSTTSKLS